MRTPNYFEGDMLEFQDKMKALLKNKYDLYLDSMKDSPYRGIRINTIKTDAKTLLPLLDFVGEKVPFCDDGYYVLESEEKIGKNPLHLAGAYYIQEPSAMSAVNMLDVHSGDTVLDLCAAPGSKTTQIASKLSGQGLLWSNEIVKNRANILLSNIERMGIRNAIVSNCNIDTLCNKLSNTFDKILVDAPCSGEGMFRKDENAKMYWSQEHVLSCAARQFKILSSAKKALKLGGTIVYSTCTFSVEENEGVINRFLDENQDFELVDSKRIFPFEGGEGHFCAKLVCNGNVQKTTYVNEIITDKKVAAFLCDIVKDNIFYNLDIIGDSIYSLPYSKSTLPDLKGLGVLRAGIKIGEIKSNRIEPHHNLFSCLLSNEAKNILNLKLNDSRLFQYIAGQEIDVDTNDKGYFAVFVEGISLGFGKVSNMRLKNKYPKGLRING